MTRRIRTKYVLLLLRKRQNHINRHEDGCGWERNSDSCHIEFICGKLRLPAERKKFAAFGIVRCFAEWMKRRSDQISVNQLPWSDANRNIENVRLCEELVPIILSCIRFHRKGANQIEKELQNSKRCQDFHFSASAAHFSVSHSLVPLKFGLFCLLWARPTRIARLPCHPIVKIRKKKQSHQRFLLSTFGFYLRKHERWTRHGSWHAARALLYPNDVIK